MPNEHSRRPQHPAQTRVPARSPGHIVTLELPELLTASNLRERIGRIQWDDPAGTPHLLLIDCSRMQDYEIPARDQFVSWMRQTSAQISRVAIVTDKPIWRVVIQGMSLATHVEMKPFADASTARRWLLRR